MATLSWQEVEQAIHVGGKQCCRRARDMHAAVCAAVAFRLPCLTPVIAQALFYQNLLRSKLYSFQQVWHTSAKIACVLQNLCGWASPACRNCNAAAAADLTAHIMIYDHACYAQTT
jgi:hypothetical protein